ncbi:phosphate ABC transporter substrate-binding protein [Effusibacillus dendaii]|uniref:Phosphate-binding protein n=1 Tax=Effusibacillus dendaii TaxID=2743772 RepID=A0A7I8DGZ1_9BACL|nr:phosphate ABC transporter substrate-binding protein [Effusibacillus dendaii]BCJ87850.1 phosphate ABC transporter substrate-binding protein [Effusibacillus dendaii]
MLSVLSKRAIGFAMVATLGLGVLTGCGSSNQQGSPAPSQGGGAQELTGTVTASGSTALQPLVNQAAKDFMDKNPKVTVNVTGGGSGTGLKQVADGSVNIGNSDVAAGPEFKDANLKEHIVAIAPFAIVVNEGVTVDNLTKDQAAKIFEGQIKNWKEVGGQDAPITIVHRPESSGSRKLVQQIVLDGKEFTKEGVTQDSSGAVATAVKSTPNSIGYVDTPYLQQGIKAVKFDGVAFSKDNIKNGTYKLFGSERMYTKGEPTGAVKAFLDFILSNDFQNNRVEQLKFLPANLLQK